MSTASQIQELLFKTRREAAKFLLEQTSQERTVTQAEDWARRANQGPRPQEALSEHGVCTRVCTASATGLGQTGGRSHPWEREEGGAGSGR